jgi:hypothetical protein
MKMLYYDRGMLAGGLSGSVLIFVAAMFCITFLIRQIFWHHLAKLVFSHREASAHSLRGSRYPGPMFAKFSDASFGIHVYRGDSHTYLYKLHQKHGEENEY